MDVLAELHRQYPGSSIAYDRWALRGELVERGHRHPVVLTLKPPGFGIAVPALEDFHLEIAWRKRWLPLPRGDRARDAGYAVRSNDPGLARLWIDDPVREALRLRAPAPQTRPGTQPWPLVVADERVTTPLFKPRETPPYLLWSRALAMQLAGAPVRWAAQVRALATELTGRCDLVRVVDRIALGDLAAVFAWGDRPVSVTYLRRAPLGGDRKLHTAFRMERHERGESWVMSTASKRHQVVGDPPRARLQPALRAGAVLATATADTIELWFEGAVVAPTIAPVALTTLAELAAAARPAGPYR